MVRRMSRMRLLVVLAMAALVLAGAAGLVRPPATRAAATLVGPKAYYLALGDSLAFGYQPNWDWSHGYADQWFPMLRAKGTVSYVNYGCPGETSATFVSGGCPYAYLRHVRYSGSQLSAAVSFLKLHPGQVSPVSLDIGANDLLGDINASTCTVSTSWSSDLKRLDTNLTQTILPQLVAALTSGGQRTGDLVMMNYYDPYQNSCANSLTYVNQLNAHLAADAAEFSVPVADVFTAFGGATTPNPNICTYTWMCSNQQDIHASGGQSGEPGNGYGVIANAFQAATYGAPQPPTTGTIAGTVTNGSPCSVTGIVGATISVGALSTTSGAGGSYSLGGVAPGSSLTVTASASGYATQSQSNVTVTSGNTTALSFNLTPTLGAVCGTVTDSVTGQPVVGATVSIGGASTTTLANGSYTLTGINPGSSLAVQVSANYYATNSTPMNVAAGWQKQDFALQPTTGIVTGQVVRANTTTGISGATVTLAGQTTSTDSSGNYTFQRVPVNGRVAQTIAASAVGYASNSTTVVVLPGKTATAPAIPLTATAGTLSGTVTVRGRVYAGATVTLSGNGLNQTTTTNGSGYYQFATVPNGAYTVRASIYWGWISQTAQVTVSGPTTHNFSF